jgi:hypothetical protein
LRPNRTRFTTSGSRVIIKHKNPQFSEIIRRKPLDGDNSGIAVLNTGRLNQKYKSRKQPQIAISDSLCQLIEEYSGYFVPNRLDNILSKINQNDLRYREVLDVCMPTASTSSQQIKGDNQETDGDSTSVWNDNCNKYSVIKSQRLHPKSFGKLMQQLCVDAWRDFQLDHTTVLEALKPEEKKLLRKHGNTCAQTVILAHDITSNPPPNTNTYTRE